MCDRINFVIIFSEKWMEIYECCNVNCDYSFLSTNEYDKLISGNWNSEWMDVYF
jgi:hypothetical protein